ncbi:hypothetical protein A2cp1_2128 [Anaeromyxobacter dehalogenans 2CP-1]|uniref:Uncharacterized protein n=1 Tax=Anaeromyxobacter dehalogenans (strain ATCC BAA-258 / DSM 21875 / 2CP-1) TaxID=455488 RepID=B8J962_ANAD2|nr:hypothetical protein [Anaeromyxobacter dehalogenans]ACL65468.1 hypothetical protein A2cp1_2128 [Anaeromyxobacter dehalogenans 2CP-1]
MNRTGSRLRKDIARDHARRAADALRRQADALDAAAKDREPVPAIAAAHKAGVMVEWTEHMLPVIKENVRRQAAAARAARRAA